MIATRTEVYAAIDTERDYQDAGSGNAARSGEAQYLTPGEALLCMEALMQQARDVWYVPGGSVKVLDFMRKISAVGVQCMEVYGAPQRAKSAP